MDEGVPPIELIRQKNYILLFLIIMSALFILVVPSGMLIVLGLLIFMLVFSNKNKAVLKKDILNSRKYDDSWFKTKYVLSKEIP